MSTLYGREGWGLNPPPPPPQVEQVVTELLVILEGLSAANRLQQLVVVLRKKLTDRRAPLPPVPLPFPHLQPRPLEPYVLDR